MIIPEFGVRSRRVTEVSAHSSLEPGCGGNWEHLAFSFCVRFSPCLCTCSSLCLELPFPLYWPINFVFIFQGSVLPSRSLGSSLIHDTASGTSSFCKRRQEKNLPPAIMIFKTCVGSAENQRSKQDAMTPRTSRQDSSRPAPSEAFPFGLARELWVFCVGMRSVPANPGLLPSIALQSPFAQ